MKTFSCYAWKTIKLYGLSLKEACLMQLFWLPWKKKKHMENPGHLKPVAESINYQWLMTVGGCSPTLANDLAALEFAFPEITSGPSSTSPSLL